MNADRSPVYAVRRNASLLDYPGRLAGIFYVAGCNFRCRYCHNSELLAAGGANFTWDQLEDASEQFLVQWVDAAVVTGGEPTTAPGLVELLKRLKARGWAVKLDTNGSRPDVLERALPYVDYIAMDVKCGLAGYPEMTAFHGAEEIRRSIELIKNRAPDYEFRTTVVEPLHTDEQVREIGALVSGARRFVLQPFLPRADLPDPALEAVARTAPERLEHLRRLVRDCADEVVVHGA